MHRKALCLAAGLASIVATNAAAQFPALDNRWVEFQKDNSHLAPNVTPTSLSNNNIETDVAWGDLDQNGFIDLVIVRKQPYTSAGKRTNKLLMNVNGVLEDWTSTHAVATDVSGDFGFNTATNDRDVVISDVDQDGWDDFVTATTLSDGDPKHIGHPRVYVNRGLGGGGNWLGMRFENARIPQLFVFSNGSAQNPRFCSVAAGDISGDTYPDLYFGDYDSSGAGGVNQGAGQDLNDRLLVNDGTGHFADQSQLRMTSQMLSSAFGMAVSIDDFNGDGVLDIMKDTALMAPQYVAVSYNNPNNPGFFNLFEDFHNNAPYHIATGDLNNDGRIDMISSSDDDDQYRYNLGNDAFGRVDWSPGREYAGAGECNGTGCTDDGFGSNALIVDIDNDGWADTIHCDVDVDIPSTQRRMHIYHNPGGTPGSQIILVEEQQVTSNNSGWKGVFGMSSLDQQGTHDVAVFDIDNDGDKDMVVSRFNGTDVWENKIIDGPPIVCAADLGLQGPGSVDLSMCGTGFGTGGALTFSLSNAPAGATACISVSFAGGVNVPFSGGVLASFSNFVTIFCIPTNGSGALNLPVSGGGGPFSVVLQAIVADGSQPLGVAISNAIQADFLP